MGIKFEANFLLVAWAFVPALMFFTKVFRMDAKDRHTLDMRMKHHSSFWVKGNMFVDGIERVVLAQAAEEDVFRGIEVNDVENAEAWAMMRKSTGDTMPISRILKNNKFAGNYASGSLPGSEVTASALAFGAARTVGVPADSSILLIPQRVWREAEQRYNNIQENRKSVPLSIS